MPCWVSFCTRYGLFYRKSLRILIKTAINFWPFIALSLGIYDLYQHMPYAHEHLLPLFELFENSLIFRIGLYVAYFFTYIFYFMQWIISALYYLFSVIQILMTPFWLILNSILPIFTTLRSLLAIVASIISNIWYNSIITMATKFVFDAAKK